MTADRSGSVPWYRSLRFKLVAAAITVELVMLSALLANNFRLLQEAIESQTQVRLEAISPLLDAALAGRVFQRDHAEVAAIIDRLTTTHLTEINYITVLDQSGSVIASAGNRNPGTLPSEDHSVVEALTDLTYDVRLPLTIIDTEVGSVHFGLSLASMVATQNRVVKEGILIAGVEILLSLLLLVSGGYLITRHIRSLTEGARRIAQGDYSLELRVTGKDEIAMLAKDFNVMAASVAAHVDELNASKMQVQAIFDMVGEAIFIHDPETGRILDVNQRMCKMYACTREQALASDVSRFSSDIPPYTMDEVFARIQAAVTGTPQIFDWQARALDGRIFWAEVSLRLAKIGEDDRLIAVIREITERKNAAKEREILTRKLHLAHKMESIGLMAGGVAHDLNNILSGIIAYPELILQKLDKESELRRPIEAIQESGQRAATVVADLLTVARGAASIREIHGLNALVQEYLESPEYKKLQSLSPDIVCRLQLTATDTYIQCSPVHVKKSIMNLVTNAYEAIVDQGTVVVATRNQHVDESITGMPGVDAGDYVVLRVEDTGPGISDTDLEHIFEPFYTKKVMGRSGTGLGLAVVWSTMEDHNGKITVESSEKGTCFELYFPISREKRIVQPDSESTEKFTGNSEHILVVDDEPQLRDIACQILREFGYRVDAVDSGEQAVEFVKKHSVDLVVLDMLMEPGMNGRQSYERIIGIRPGQKAIIISGFSESDEVKRALRLGVGGFIKKPYSMEQLGQAVRDALQFS